MVEKRVATKRVAKNSTSCNRSTTAKSAATKATAAKKAEIVVDAENAGFRAGDVYQALSAAGGALSVAELAKATEKTETEVLLGIGWLLKEGKVKGESGKVVLA